MTIRDIFGTGVLYRLGLAVFASVAFAVFSNNDTVRAVTPEACFTFSSLNKSITGYLYDGVDCGVSVDIPSTINSYEVLAIGNGAFSYKGIESVKIPGSVTSIGISAFSNNKLSSIDLPVGLTSIGIAAFDSNKLTFVKIPDGITHVPFASFQNNLLSSVSIPDSVTSIGNGAFQQNKLSQVTLPASVQSVGDVAFANNFITDVSVMGNPTLGFNAFNWNHEYPSTIQNAQQFL